ncbi:hypothetical protein BAL199_03339 [alpha proteobacterium BAL199]|jgi:hypothetical protein|nr:hypothetical protein BAL199_03339 [alpha proteobacterium BAL199]
MRENASLEAGFVFPERRIIRTAEDQARWLAAAGADPEIWAGIAEPTLWGNDGFRGMKLVRQQPNGYVHVQQVMTVGAHAAIGEEIRFRGLTESVEPVRKGRMVTQRFDVVRDNGEVAATLTHIGLLPDPAAMTAPDRGRAGSGDPDDLGGLEPIAEQTLTPDRVTTFSREVGNLIHFDPEFAQSLGYRAPLAQGLQTMTWMVDALGPVAPLTVRCRFRRPVFWDDAMCLLGQKGHDGRWCRLVTTNATGRITADLTVG